MSGLRLSDLNKETTYLLTSHKFYFEARFFTGNTPIATVLLCCLIVIGMSQLMHVSLRFYAVLFVPEKQKQVNRRSELFFSMQHRSTV